MLFCCLLIFFSKSAFSKNSLRNTIRVSNSLDPDQAQHFVSTYLGPNCLQRLSADDTICKCYQQTTLVNKQLNLSGLNLHPPPPPPHTHTHTHTIYDECRLLLYVYFVRFGCLYYKQYVPRSDCYLRSSLIWVHS